MNQFKLIIVGVALTFCTSTFAVTPLPKSPVGISALRKCAPDFTYAAGANNTYTCTLKEFKQCPTTWATSSTAIYMGGSTVSYSYYCSPGTTSCKTGFTAKGIFNNSFKCNRTYSGKICGENATGPASTYYVNNVVTCTPK